MNKFVPSVVPQNAIDPRVIADIEGLGRRVNDLIQGQGDHTTIIQQIIGSPPPPPTNIIAGNGLSFEADGITLDVNVDGSNIVITSDILNLSTTGVSAGTYGDATHSGRFTVDAYGRLTAASNVAITGTVPNGTTTNSLLRWSGSAWVEGTYVLVGTSFMQVGAGTPTASVEASIFGTGGTSQPRLLEIHEVTSAANSATVAVVNDLQGKGFEGGIVGTANDGWTGTAQGDAFLRQTGGGGRLWLGIATTKVAAFDGTTINFYSKLDMGAKAIQSLLDPVNAQDAMTLAYANAHYGAGTVTSFSAGNFSPLFTTSVATATTTPALTFTAVTQSANLGFYGPSSGAAAAPTFRAQVPLDWASGAATGGLPYASSGTANAWLAAGATGTVLTIAGGVPTWASVAVGSITGGTAGRILYDNGTVGVWSAAGSTGQTLRMVGTVPTFNSILTNDGTGITISPTTGATGITINADSGAGAWITNSATPSASSGGGVSTLTTANPTAIDQRLGAYFFGSLVSSTLTLGARFFASSEESWATNHGTYVGVAVNRAGTTGTFDNIMQWRGNRDVIAHASGSEEATSTTGGFFFLGTCNGPPTGVPSRSVTGAMPIVIDRANNRLYYYNGSWINLSPLSNAALTIQNKTANYTLVMGDFYVTADTSSGNFTIKLPDAATNTNPANTIYYFKNIGTSGTVTVTVLTTTDKLNGTANANIALGGVASRDGGKAAFILNGTDYQRVPA